MVDVSPPLYVGVALSRRERDFTDSERTLLDRARPYLIGIYRTAIAYSNLLAEMHAREQDDPQLESPSETATNRSHAAAIAWDLAQPQ